MRKAATALMAAAGHCHDQAVPEYLLNQVGSMDLRDVDGNTLLLLAVLGRQQSAIAPLLRHGSDVNVRNSARITPLLAAANPPQPAVVRLLLSSGAKVNVRDINGYSPLHAAAGCGDPEVTRLLLESGADPVCVHPAHGTASALARKLGFVELVAMIDSFSRAPQRKK